MPRPLLVAGEHVAERRPARERVVDRQDRPAGDAEDGVHALGLEGSEDGVGAVHQTGSGWNSTSVRADGIRSRTTSMKSRVVEAGPLPSRSAVRAPEASACDTARSSVLAAARSPRPSPSISEAASRMPLGFATPWPAICGAEPWVGPKTPRPVEREAAGGDDPGAVPACGCEVGDELGVLLLGDDHAEPVRRVHQLRQHLAQRGPLDLDARMLLRLPRDKGLPRLAVADGGDRRAAGAGEVECPADDERLELLDERADDGDVAVRKPDTLDAPGEVEVGLDALERRLAGECDQHRVGHPARGTCRDRQRMAVAGDSLAREGRVHLVDSEAVQPSSLGDRAARFSHQLGADAVPTQTGNGVALFSLHVAGTSSKTSYRVTALRSSASRLNRMKAALELGGGQLDAGLLARAGECVAAGMLSERESHCQPQLLGIHDLVGRDVLQHPVLVDPGLVRERVRPDDRLVALHGVAGQPSDESRRRADLA